MKKTVNNIINNSSSPLNPHTRTQRSSNHREHYTYAGRNQNVPFSNNYANFSFEKRARRSPNNQDNHSLNKTMDNKDKEIEFSPYQHRSDQQLLPIFTTKPLPEQLSLKKHSNNRQQQHSNKIEQTANFSPYSQRKSDKKKYEYHIKPTIDPFIGQPNQYYDQAKKIEKLITPVSKYRNSFNHPPITTLLPQDSSSYLGHQNYIRKYEDNRDQIIDQLLRNNKLLIQENNEQKQWITRLQNDLRVRESKIKILGQKLEKKIYEERLHQEQIMSQMTNQIKLLLEKNDILKQKVEELKIREAQKIDHQDIEHKDIVEDLIQYLNKEYFQKIVRDKDPGRIKYSKRELKNIVSGIVKRNIKLQSFANCLIDMRTKLTRQKEDRDLKRCWKWLKQLVQQCSKLKKISGFQKQARKLLNASQSTPIEQVLSDVLKRLNPQ